MLILVLMISAENDPLQLRPNPENLISKVSAEDCDYFQFYVFIWLAHFIIHVFIYRLY